MEPNSFTTEPQYQRPDQRNSEIDYIRRPIPIIIPQPAPVTVPVPAPVPVITPINKFAYDGATGYLTCNEAGTYDFLINNSYYDGGIFDIKKRFSKPNSTMRCQ